MLQVGEQICHVSTCQRPECMATGACHRALATTPSVRIPSGEDEAVLMVLLGTKWLQDNAPHRLTPNGLMSRPATKE